MNWCAFISPSMIVRKGLSKQAENDCYMWNARNIKRFANQVVTVENEECLEIVIEEINYLIKALTLLELRDDSDIHNVLRGRLEYTLSIVGKICQCSSSLYFAAFIEKSLINLLRLSSIIEDFVVFFNSQRSFKLSKEGRNMNYFSRNSGNSATTLGADRTEWSYMCLTALSHIINQAMRRLPSSRSLLKVSLAESVGVLCHSEHWQRRYIALGMIAAGLIAESEIAISSVINGNGSDCGMDEAPAVLIRQNTTKMRSVVSQQQDNNVSAKRGKSVKTLLASSSNAELSATRSSSGKSQAAKVLKKAGSTLTQQLVSEDDSSPTHTLSGTTTLLSAGNVKSLSVISSSGARGRSSLMLLSQVEELCKSGFLRTLHWVLLHSHECVRKAAAELVELILLRCQADDEADNSLLSELWGSCVEQGLVPQLELISSGITTKTVESAAHGNPTGELFPEPIIRHVCGQLLDVTAAKLVRHEVLRSRVLNSMSYTGNSKLKLNIFSGLLFLAGRSVAVDEEGMSLGRMLWEAKQSQTSSTPIGGLVRGGAVFFELMANCAADTSQLRGFIQIMESFLTAAKIIRTSGNYNAGAIATQTNQDAEVNRTSRLAMSIEPVVVVLEAGRATRMVCPLCSLVASHSESLAHALLTTTLSQLSIVGTSSEAAASTSEYVSHHELLTNATSRIAALDNSHFVALEGTYAVWQEVFSHMVDSYIMQSSVAHMSVASIAEALRIASFYDMKVLRRHYSEVLAQRLTSHTFLQIFHAGLGVKPREAQVFSSQSSVCSETLTANLVLVTASLKFLDQHADQLVAPRRTLETSEIIKCLHAVIYCLLV